MRVHQKASRNHRAPLFYGLIWVVVVVCLVLAPQLAMAQQAAPSGGTGQDGLAPNAATNEPSSSNSQQDHPFSEANRRRMYESSRLSTSGAVLRNLAFPGLGNIYADQYFYAGIAFSFMVFTGVFVGYGLATDQSEFLWLGAGTAGIAYGGSIVTSIFGVQEYNAKLRQGLKLEEADATPWSIPRAPTVRLGWTF